MPADSRPAPPTAADVAALCERDLVVFALPAESKRADYGWHDRLLADAAAVDAHWKAGDNIGVACRASGVVGIDLDVKHDGPARFAAVCAEAGRSWPQTFTVDTPSGGCHLYFRAPADRIIASYSGAISPLGLGVDVRAPGRRLGSYLAAPGSVIAGRSYRIALEVPIMPLPKWLTEILGGGRRHRPAPTWPTVSRQERPQ